MGYCDRCGRELGRPNVRGSKTFCCSCADWWDNREHRPGGIEGKPWVHKWRMNLMKNKEDFDGNKLKNFMESGGQLTVGELKKRLVEYPDGAKIYMEASNAYIRNDTLWAQRALNTYPCREDMTDKKALMIVGSMK